MNDFYIHLIKQNGEKSMTDENVKQVLMAIGDKVPEEKLPLLKNSLAAAPDSKVDEILCANLHNPTHILLFSIFLGGLGVDRFMIGDTGLGVAKLLFGWVTCGIWPLIDIFISYKRAKEKNINKLISIV